MCGDVLALASKPGFDPAKFAGRAAELRAYVVVFDTLDRRAFGIDPDGAVLCGTFAGFELTAFRFERARTAAWTIAPHTDVRGALENVERIARAQAAL